MNSSTSPVDIRPDHLEIVQNILREHLPAGFQVWVFGSRANWATKDSSDLDLAVEGTDSLGYKTMIGLEVAFEESDLPYTVDVVDLNAVSDTFRHIVEQQRAPLPTADGAPTVNSNWSEVTLGDLAVINDATYSLKEEWTFVNYLDTGNITENRISEIQHLVSGVDKLPSRARRKVKPGDIVYSTVRPNQRHFGLIKDVPDNFLASTGFAVIRGKEYVACTDFIYWFLAQNHIAEYLHSIAENSTSAYPSIRSSDLEQLTLSLPPLAEQRAIAHILGALDDKIDLNRRMNQTLEEMGPRHIPGLVRGLRPRPRQAGGTGTLPAAGPVGPVPPPPGRLGTGADTGRVGGEANRTSRRVEPQRVYQERDNLPIY